MAILLALLVSCGGAAVGGHFLTQWIRGANLRPSMAGGIIFVFWVLCAVWGYHVANFVNMLGF